MTERGTVVDYLAVAGAQPAVAGCAANDATNRGGSGVALRDLRKSYGARQVLAGVSFSVAAGEFVALLGSSGAGKTTLLRCIAGLAAADGGDVRIDGRVAATLRGRERRSVAMVFQQFSLIERVSALDNVLAGRLGHVPRWRGWARRFSRADRLLALECLERVGLLDAYAQRADTLSGGQQQRVAIARALAQQARVILADEPVASLDPSTGAGVLELLREICRERGVAVLCSLHQPELARSHADRLIGLRGGVVVCDLPAGVSLDAVLPAIYGDARVGAAADQVGR